MTENKKDTTAISKREEQAITKQLSTTPYSTILQQLIKSGNTGVKTEADGLLMLMKAQELGIGFGNAIPHMHVVSGKPGIDIHIVKGILSKPSAYVSWELVKNYEPVYQVITQEGAIVKTNDNFLEQTLKLVPFKKLETAEGEDDEIIASHIINKNKPTIVDYETKYIFTREKKNLKEEIITTTSIGYFSESMMRAASLHLNKAGLESPDSAWTKYRQLMIATRAFTYGARDIASDLLLGNYETTELFDTMNIEYTTEVVDGEIIATPKTE